ncbi:MAG TPA: hypothetical protein VNT26_17195 [Candidatus Sulfotelmatobacter sp.]|nr:hypothetical protein [Candidatus Sulfotelmatobacter sp.]
MPQFTLLQRVKDRLEIAEATVTWDTMLTRAIEHYSARFDRECHRQFERRAGAEQVFRADQTVLVLEHYPVEVVSKFEMRYSEGAVWQEIIMPDYVVTGESTLELVRPQGTAQGRLRVTYTGGYALPALVMPIGPKPLPDDLEGACLEQVAWWYQNRATAGVQSFGPVGGAATRFADVDLLPSVKAVLKRHQRMIFT